MVVVAPDQRPRVTWRRGRNAVVVGAFLLAACSVFPETPDPPPGPLLFPEQLVDAVRERVESERLEPASDADLRALGSVPIVDVHTHTFNARYLPLRNVLLGKRDAARAAILLQDDTAKRVAAAIASATPLEEIEGLPRRVEDAYLPKEAANGTPSTAAIRDDLALEAERAEAGFLAGLRSSLFDRYRDLRGDLGADEEQILALSGLDDVEARLLERLQSGDLQEVDWALRKLHEATGIASYGHFLASLVANDGLQDARFRADYAPGSTGASEGPAAGGASPIALHVSHMMDLAPVYGQEEDWVLLEPFALSQVPRMAHFQERAEARMVYFVAYNPFRDNRGPWGGSGKALEIVREAIETHGAWGVKVYPPSGYRPARNAIPRRPATVTSEAPGKQWDARYAGVSNALLDRRLDALFAYCAERDLPVFAHCAPGEFEARKGYAAHMADPRWWRPVLERYPDLRLCFGHAGGPDFWFEGAGKHADWGRLVYELCVTYPNVYCEFGVYANVVDEDERAFFTHLLRELFARGEGFEAKILYGSDWFMPREVGDQVAYLDAWRRTFHEQHLAPHYEGFFHANALAFLDVKGRLARAGQNGVADLPQAVRDRLGALLAE